MKNQKLQEFIVVVLAAGQGKRMGIPKVLAKYENKTFAEYIRDTLEMLDITSLWVFSDKKIKDRTFDILKRDYPFIFNFQKNGDMFSSIVAASFSQELSKKKYIFVLPVDFPFVSAPTFDLLIQQARVSAPKTDLLIPSYHGKKGHPVLLSVDFFTKAVSYIPKFGLKEIFEIFSPVTVFIETKDPFILKNINKPSDF